MQFLAIEVQLPEFEGFLKYGYIGLAVIFAILVYLLLRQIVAKTKQPTLASVFILIAFLLVAAIGGALLQFATQTTVNVTKTSVQNIKTGYGNASYENTDWPFGNPNGTSVLSLKSL